MATKRSFTVTSPNRRGKKLNSTSPSGAARKFANHNKFKSPVTVSVVDDRTGKELKYVATPPPKSAKAVEVSYRGGPTIKFPPSYKIKASPKRSPKRRTAASSPKRR